jgi:hypothetical protein
MYGASQAADALEHKVVDIRVSRKFRGHVVAPGFERRTILRVDMPLRIVGCVQLDVVTAQRGDLGDHLRTQVVSDGAEEVLGRGIGRT